MRNLAIVVAIWLAGMACAVPVGRTLYAGFEGSLEASEARGGGAGTPEGKPQFVEGKVGQGLLLGDLQGSAAALYETAGNVSLERGTMAMWVKPVNWQGDDKQNHLFWQLPLGEKGYYLLYKYTGSWGLAFYIDPEEGARAKMVAYKPITDWKPGEWHHLACAWTKFEGMKVYVDGKEVASSAGVSLTDKPMKPQMRVGGSWATNGDQTVVDELMVFGRMLSAAEIAELAGSVEGPATSRPAVGAVPDIPGVMLTHAILGQKVLARVYRDALGEPATEAQLTLLQGDKTVAETRRRLATDLTTLSLDLSKLPRGEYQARLGPLRTKEEPICETLRISKETDDTWETVKRLAKQDRVLPPFEPLRVQGSSVQCVGPRYDFARSGLVRAIQSREQPLLAGPVRVRLNGEPLTETAGEPQVLKTSDVQAELRGKSDGPLALQTDITARYDGTVWSRLTMTPRQPQDVQKLTVEIPLRPEIAKYFAFNVMSRADEKRFGYGALPAGDGVVFSREFLPSLWLGTEDLGLGWYAESDQNWDLEGENAITVERRGGETVLCMNIIRKPRRVEREFSIEFGLQGTPVRPLPKDWRAYQWVPSVEISRFFLGLRKRPYPREEVAGRQPSGRVAYLYTYHEYFTNTLPKDPDEFREMVARVKSYGGLATPYTDTTFIPEWAGDYLEHQEMRSLPGARGASYGPVCTIDCCHQGAFGDWFVWYVSHLAKEYGSNGIYLDDMWPYGCSNEAHGCGYVGPDGKRRVTYPLRARLETYRRLREVFADTGEPFYLSYHISAGRCSPLPTFGDGLLMAEERNPIVGKNPDYTTNTTSEEWLASFSPEAWGIPVYMIPQFKMNNEWMKDPELAERMLAAVVPHDIAIWPLFVDHEPVMRVRQAMAAFGVGEPDVRVIGFWQKDDGISYSASQVRVTGYLRPGKLLLCAGNLAEEEALVNVELDLAKLGLGQGKKTVPVKVPGKRLELVEVRR